MINKEKLVKDYSAIPNQEPEVKPAPDMTPMAFEEGYSTKILLVRHGRSIANEVRIYLGHTDEDLSPRGYMQAERTAELLSGVKIDEIYSSSLIRAVHTAEPHARLRGLNVKAEDRLREVFVGEWENRKVEDIQKEYEHEFFEGWVKNFGTFTLPGGESVPHAAERFLSRVREIAVENEGKTVMIASHAAVIRASFAKVKGIAPERVAAELPFPDNASVSVIYYKDGELIAGEYSHSAHLSDI